MNEKKDFHPLVAQWLETNGYTYRYEVRLPEYGRADFIAQHDDGHTLIVECETDEATLTARSVIDLVDYRRQMPDSRAGYAVPAHLVSSQVSNLCDTYAIKLISIEVPADLQVESRKTRREKTREINIQTIKKLAHRQMEEGGTAALSLRGIASEMKMTAPALYRYFDDRDHLLTALIIDAFNALADSLESARDTHKTYSYGEQLLAVFLAYRSWALAHPIDFQLIYGNPIPGYEAPREVTVPAVVRGFAVWVGLLDLAAHAGELVARPPDSEIPPATEQLLREIIEQGGYPITTLSLYLGINCWTDIHGIITLEVYDHLPPNVGDTDAYYRRRVLNMLHHIGLKSLT